jgi:16S rRNA (cytidine1402-2'-O)-methyltransferase
MGGGDRPSQARNWPGLARAVHWVDHGSEQLGGKPNMTIPGRLFVVSVPIGNPGDITLRAIDVLRAVDGVICEEYRQASTLLKRLGIEKRLIGLSEHTERSVAEALVQEMLLGKQYALISDAGTPVFADPGRRLLQLLAEFGVPAAPVPGASSLMAALSLCEFDLRRFIFGGFLPRSAPERRQDLRNLRRSGLPVVIMDTPYRMGALLSDVMAVYGPGHVVFLACDLTLPTEAVFRGPVSEIAREVGDRKSEFVAVVAAVERERPT